MAQAQGKPLPPAWLAIRARVARISAQARTVRALAGYPDHALWWCCRERRRQHRRAFVG
jgi:hypothetical protein